MKVLEIATDTPPYKGGIARLVGVLIEGLRKHGVHVDVEAPRYRFGEFKLSFIPLKKHDDYDVVHIHGPTPFLSDISLLTNGCSIVYTHHAEIRWLSENMSQLYTRFHRFLACRKARMIVVHSQEYARLFKEKNVVVIRMPCFFKPQSNVDPDKKHDPFTVLYVGQLRPFKGLDVLLKTAAMLEEVNFIIAGDGYLRQKLFQKAKNMNNIKMVGAVNDNALAELYSSSHVICLPSTNTTEAYGLVLIEGALHGCVPTASNLIGVRENVSQLQGLLFKTGSYMSLAQKIRMLSSDRELYLKLAKKAQKAAQTYVNTYTPESYVKEHEKVFTQCF